MATRRNRAQSESKPLSQAAAAPAGATPTEGAQSVRRAFALLRAVAAAQERGARLVDLALAAGVPPPTAFRLLKVLAEEGAVERDAATRRYKIGVEVGLLGIARGGNVPLRAIADPYLRRLSDAVQDTVFLTVRQGLDSVAIDRKTGSHPIQVLATEVGVRRPLGAGVAGVAMLACLPPAEAAALCAANAARLARQGVDAAALLARVSVARELGHAWAAAGVVPGTSAVSVAVRDAAGSVLGAVSVAAMADRLGAARLPRVVQALHEQAASIGRRHDDVQRARQR